MNNPINKIKCPECNGDGYGVDYQITPECCGYGNDDGSCCGNPVQGRIPVQVICEECHGEGYIFQEETPLNDLPL